MKTKIACLTLLSLATAMLLLPACSKSGDAATAAAPAKTEVRRYPLKGVVVEVQAGAFALLVKHEDIPGFMPGMTMLFKVDATTLKVAAPHQAITATLVPRGDELWLEDVKPVGAN